VYDHGRLLQTCKIDSSNKTKQDLFELKLSSRSSSSTDYYLDEIETNKKLPKNLILTSNKIKAYSKYHKLSFHGIKSSLIFFLLLFLTNI
jgi:hypothetical protein